MTTIRQTLFISSRNQIIVGKHLGLLNTLYAYHIKRPTSNPVTIEFLQLEMEKIDKILICFQSDIVVFNHSLTTPANYTDGNVIVQDFFVPVTGYYNITLYIESTLFGQFFTNVTNLDHVNHNISTLDCIGPYYEHRWCRARNVCYQNSRFYFYGLENARFNQSIMTPGAQPIPSDYPSCRKIVRFVVSEQQFPAFQLITNRSYLVCRWYGMQHYWHALVDFTLPLFWATYLNGGSHRESDLIFSIDTNNSTKGMMFLPSFTSHELRMMRVHNESLCFADAVIGFPKSERDYVEGKYKSALDMPYEFDPAIFPGFRQHMVEYFLDGQCPTLPKKRIVIVFRTSPKRHIVNKVELTDTIAVTFPEYEVVSAYLENMSLAEQISLVCSASVLIAIHGSGLSSALWMDPNMKRGVIEIFPYGYSCRDWYERLVTSAGAKYMSYTPLDPDSCILGRPNNGHYEECKYGARQCLTSECHDVLRDQLVTVEIRPFLMILGKMIKQLND